MEVGVVGAEVKTLGDVAALVTLGGAGLMFNNMLIFKSLNHPVCSTQQQYIRLPDWTAFFMLKDTVPFDMIPFSS